MKTITKLGKLLTMLFWIVVLANLLNPFAQPFGQLLNLAGAGLLLLRVLELLLFAAPLSAQVKPWRARVQVLLFGAFALANLAKPVPEQASFVEVAHA